MDILDILGLVWDTQLVIAQKDLSPYGRQAVVFLTSLATDNLGPVCPRGEQTGVLPPFCEATPPPPHSPCLCLLWRLRALRLQCKQLALWEEVSSLLTKAAGEIGDLSHD